MRTNAIMRGTTQESRAGMLNKDERIGDSGSVFRCENENIEFQLLLREVATW